ncbi:CPBP family intramembrane glutamic endopeptidase [Ktedonobacter robiniae]|uniref:CAAX prenyl protease 2/Lysostaphin resistance protein A-like domain-containing protein n=1 Tax=Ktedonobacter robiniae TaxID=2778365 RepID=A0ABQ3UX60_9CHLR|nr:CPBP family intramembrane glutamic endopeptidase [Ktedonobacter robiniae]GHO57286.1 hypothetical protein KSB_57610 [Ktedonobacter robiniae]
MQTLCNNNNSMKIKKKATFYTWWLLASLLATLFTLLPAYSSIPLFYKLLRDLPAGEAIANLSHSPKTIPAALGFTLYWLIASCSTFLMLWIWMCIVERRGLWPFRLPRWQALRTYLQGLLLGVVLMSVIVCILLSSGTAILQLAGSAEGGGVAALLFTLIGWMAQGPKEEIVYRGWLLSRLTRRYGRWFSIMISSLVFALAHILNPHVNLLALFNLTLFGVLCALCVLADGNIWRVAGLHTAWNWMQGHIFALPVSGVQYHGGNLFLFQNTYATLLNGGDFGPEGGLVVTLVLVLGISLICLRQQALATPEFLAKRVTQPL